MRGRRAATRRPRTPGEASWGVPGLPDPLLDENNDELRAWVADAAPVSRPGAAIPGESAALAAFRSASSHRRAGLVAGQAGGTVLPRRGGRLGGPPLRQVLEDVADALAWPRRAVVAVAGAGAVALASVAVAVAAPGLSDVLPWQGSPGPMPSSSDDAPAATRSRPQRTPSTDDHRGRRGAPGRPTGTEAGDDAGSGTRTGGRDRTPAAGTSGTPLPTAVAVLTPQQLCARHGHGADAPARGQGKQVERRLAELAGGRGKIAGYCREVGDDGQALPDVTQEPTKKPHGRGGGKGQHAGRPTGAPTYGGVPAGGAVGTPSPTPGAVTSSPDPETTAEPGDPEEAAGGRGNGGNGNGRGNGKADGAASGKGKAKGKAASSRKGASSGRTGGGRQAV